MQIYIIISAIMLIVTFWGFCMQEKPLGRFSIKILSVVVTLFLIFFSGLRYEIGPDYFAYESVFRMIGDKSIQQVLFSEFGDNHNMEKGYLLVNSFIHFFSLNFNAFLLFFSALSIGLKFHYFKKYSPYILFSLAIYYFQYYLSSDFAQIRQSFAISLTLWASHYIFIEKKYIAVGLIFLASFFHLSALVFFLAFFIKSNRIDYKLLYVFVFVGLLMSFFEFQSAILSKISFGHALLDSKLHGYLDSDEYGNNAILSLGNLSRLFFASILVFFHEEIKNHKYLHYAGTMYLVGYIIFAFFSFNQIFAGRLSAYFKIFEVVMFAHLLCRVRLNNIRNYVFVTIFFMLYCCIQSYKQFNYISTAQVEQYQNYQFTLKFLRD